MRNGTSKATERSEGGSKPTRTGRRAVLTEIVMVRVSKADLVAFEDEAAANDWTVSQAIRVLARRSLAAQHAEETTD